MPSWLQALGVFLAQIISPMTARVMGALGLGAISLTGVQVTLNQIINHIKGAFGGVTADILNMITLAGFDVFIGLVISAYIGVISIRSFYGAFKRFGFMDLGAGDS